MVATTGIVEVGCSVTVDTSESPSSLTNHRLPSRRQLEFRDTRTSPTRARQRHLSWPITDSTTPHYRNGRHRSSNRGAHTHIIWRWSCRCPTVAAFAAPAAAPAASADSGDGDSGDWAATALCATFCDCDCATVAAILPLCCLCDCACCVCAAAESGCATMSSFPRLRVCGLSGARAGGDVLATGTRYG
jgi:hypothetical protein